MSQAGRVVYAAAMALMVIGGVIAGMAVSSGWVYGHLAGDKGRIGDGTITFWDTTAQEVEYVMEVGGHHYWGRAPWKSIVGHGIDAGQKDPIPIRYSIMNPAIKVEEWRPLPDPAGILGLAITGGVAALAGLLIFALYRPAGAAREKQLETEADLADVGRPYRIRRTLRKAVLGLTLFGVFTGAGLFMDAQGDSVYQITLYRLHAVPVIGGVLGICIIGLCLVLWLDPKKAFGKGGPGAARQKAVVFVKIGDESVPITVAEGDRVVCVKGHYYAVLRGACIPVQSKEAGDEVLRRLARAPQAAPRR